MTIRHTTTNPPHYHSTHYAKRPVPKGQNFMHIKHTVTYTHTEPTIPTPYLHYTKCHKPRHKASIAMTKIMRTFNLIKPRLRWN